MENHNMHPVESAGHYGKGLLILFILVAIWSGHGYGAGRQIAHFAAGVGDLIEGIGGDRGAGEVDGSSPAPAIPLNRDGTIATPEEVLGQ